MRTVYVLGNVNPFSAVRSDEFFKSRIALKKHFAQKSVLAFDAAGLPIGREQIRYDNEWAAEQVFDELTKNYMKEILTSPADYVVIDMLGCVIPLREAAYRGKKTTVTYSNHVARVLSGLNDEGVTVSDRKINMNVRDIVRKISQFCEEILKVYDQRQIIVHRAGYPKFYQQNGTVLAYDEKTILPRRENERKLHLIYDGLQEKFPYANYIEMYRGACAAAKETHFTYDRDYMEYLALSALMYIEPETAQYFLREWQQDSRNAV